MLENSFIIDIAIKKFDAIVPIITLIGSLASIFFALCRIFREGWMEY